LRAAEAYALWLGVSVQNWMAESYFTLVVMFMLAMGLGFEMPVVLLALVKLGILDYSQLMAARKYMVVICLVVGAMLTPPDVVTQILMALPLMILFEVTIWIARYWRWREKKQTEAQEAS
ncbi:MAG: twin-arginine translocase subunit TatC, partial [Verrucomicrobia bacterium]|nr:twin-arginine translocase subunit TatC [Verrucomicrobiota bacterium]